MTTLAYFAAALGVIFVSAPARAQTPGTSTFLTNQDLAAICKSSDTDIMCAPYIFGVQDTISMLRGLGFIKRDEFAFCVPDGITKKTFLATMIATLRPLLDHDAKLSEKSGTKIMGPMEVFLALNTAFPCQKPTSK